MSNRDIRNNVEAVESLRPAAHGGTSVDGEAVDLQGCDSNVIVASVGAAASADAATLFAVLESDAAGSGFAVATDVVGVPVSIVADTAYQFAYTGSKRYIKVRVVTGAATTVTASAMVVKAYLSQAPADFAVAS
jgi:hypothetical protein